MVVVLADMAAGRSAGFAAFVGRFAARFPRVESRRQMRAYVRGLLSEAERKNGWTLAEAAGDAGPERMQRLLNFYPWDCDGVRDDLRAAVVEALGDARDGVLIVDEAGFLKKGNKSAGVARQYSGTAGRTENAQIGVFLAYASRSGRALIDRELYLPKEWITDRDRCRLAGIGDEVLFATKRVLAQQMIDRAVRARVPFGWVTGNEADGHDSRLRMWLEAKDIAHVLAVQSHKMAVSRPSAKVGVKPAIDTVRAAAWVRVNYGHGRQGPRWYDWTVVDSRPLRRRGRGRWLLARRSISDPAEIACYICFGPAETTVAELARVAGTRRAIGECVQTAKDETGLGHYQVRGYQAWYRHITLSMAAAAFLVITGDVAKKGDPAPAVTG